MFTLLLIIHIIVCFFLIFIVLVQSGKGAELGAAFGGSSQTLFGARGAATVFSKLTTIAAVVFMLTSLSLAIVESRSSSVVKRVPATAEQRKSLPAVPAAPGAPAQGTQPVMPGKTGLPAAPSAPSGKVPPPGAPAK
ncbi:MAG TPA: preprotein translocase subunit SecG [Candidatus Sulfobium mesophilum]|nr:preprotein translocase subunit SecG [Candidatus Sulfobium mesophilum]